MTAAHFPTYMYNSVCTTLVYSTSDTSLPVVYYIQYMCIRVIHVSVCGRVKQIM